VRKLTQREPDPEKARQRYREAELEFQAAVAARRKGAETESRQAFGQAARKYREAAKRWPDSSLEEDALFWAAEGQFFADHYPKATKGYQELVKKYGNTRYMDRVASRQFAVAEYWLDLEKRDSTWPVTPNLTDNRRPRFDTFGNALKLFDRIRFDDPAGKLSDDATMAAANANFLAGKYQRADTLYGDLRESFPSSQHQFNAHMLGLKCKLLIYEGPQYDGTVLVEAEELIKRMFRLFPNEAESQRQYLENAMGDVRLRKAQREWVMAQYYDRRKEYRAARYYYELVRRDYSDTNLAKEAQTRMDQIAKLPDVPPQRMAWLADLFPTTDEAKPLITRNNAGTRRR
jgi:outer membrane protein assembly factor BamD (BamD/ComL family)